MPRTANLLPKLFVLGCLLAAATPDFALAQLDCNLTPSASASEPYNFISSAIDALAHIQTGLDATTQGGESGDGLRALYGMKWASREFACAALVMKGFHDSDNESLRDLSQSLYVVLVVASKNMDEAVEMTLAGTADLDRLSDLMVNNKEIWKTVASGSSIVHMFLIDFAASDGGQDAPLFITHAQRRALMNKLVRLFGESVSQEPGAGNTGRVGAQMVYKGLSDLGARRDRNGSKI